MMTDMERSECLMEVLQELCEDARMIALILCGAQAPADRLTLDCLLRLSDYLNQHVNDICVLYKRDRA